MDASKARDNIHIPILDTSFTNPRSVEAVFTDFKGCRTAIIKALTTEVEEFCKQCDPGSNENLCLYGFPDEKWQVNLPDENIPSELPDPTLGINFARETMRKKDWLSLVAARSDAWLIAVAFFFGGRFQFDKADRERLFMLINDLPNIYEVLNGISMEQVEEMLSDLNLNGSNSGFESGEDDDEEEEEEKDDDEDEDGDDNDGDGEGLYEEDIEELSNTFGDTLSCTSGVTLSRLFGAYDDTLSGASEVTLSGAFGISEESCTSEVTLSGLFDPSRDTLSNASGDTLSGVSGASGDVLSSASRKNSGSVDEL